MFAREKLSNGKAAIPELLKEKLGAICKNHTRPEQCHRPSLGGTCKEGLEGGSDQSLFRTAVQIKSFWSMMVCLNTNSLLKENDPAEF